MIALTLRPWAKMSDEDEDDAVSLAFAWKKVDDDDHLYNRFGGNRSGDGGTQSRWKKAAVQDRPPSEKEGSCSTLNLFGFSYQPSCASSRR